MVDRVYGWTKDKADSRDKTYAAHRFSAEAPVQLPPVVDLAGLLPVAYDQGQLGSCTANAIAGALQFLQAKQKAPENFTPSRLFIYYLERMMEGTCNEDAGAQIRDGVKAVHTFGAPPEAVWPYDVTKFKKRPPFSAFREGRKHQALDYFRVDWKSLHEVKACLAAGFPIVFGFQVYESFETEQVSQSGVMPVPDVVHEANLGGHAVLAVGYSDPLQAVLVRNSWGEHWGIRGDFWMPYEVITSPTLSDDFWTIRGVEQ